MKNELVRKSIIFLITTLFAAINIIPSSSMEINKDFIVFTNKQRYSALDFDQNITDLMKQGGIQSLSACIIENDTVILSKGYGHYNKIPTIEPTNNTVYWVCSISKTFTATALMQLYEKGLFDLDNNVNKYLPFNITNPYYPNVNITFRLLLSHQSGLYWTTLNDQIKLGAFLYLKLPKSFCFKQYLVPGGIIYQDKVWDNSKPGEKFHYSDIGFDFLAYLVEIISGKPFDSYCKENIFQPLMMNNTSFNFKDFPRKNHANTYVHYKKILFKVPLYNIPYLGSGGLHTTTSDLSHFLIAHMNGGSYNGVRILNESTVALMHTVYYPRNITHPNGVYNFQYALGWSEWNKSGVVYGGHDGGFFGATAFMRYRIPDKKGVILFTDTFGEFPEDTLSQIEELNLHRKILQEFFNKADEL